MMTRDGTAEPVSRDQVLRREWGHEIIIFLCSADPSWFDKLTRSTHTLLCMYVGTYGHHI